jgi:hypothetical protein
MDFKFNFLEENFFVKVQILVFFRAFVKNAFIGLNFRIANSKTRNGIFLKKSPIVVLLYPKQKFQFFDQIKQA